MSEPVSVLEGARAEPRPGLVVEDRGPVGMVTLKGNLASPVISEAVNAMVGAGVPAPLSMVTGQNGRRAVWMAPDELLILTDSYHDASAIEAGERAGLAEEHAMVLNVSGARAVFRLAGADVPETLAKGVPVDLSPGAFPIGHARRTHLSGLAVALWRLGPEDWEIVCARSYARYLWDWLIASGQPGARVGRF